jgi:hypothetical protein
MAELAAELEVPGVLEVAERNGLGHALGASRQPDHGGRGEREDGEQD